MTENKVMTNRRKCLDSKTRLCLWVAFVLGVTVSFSSFDLIGINLLPICLYRLCIFVYCHLFTSVLSVLSTVYRSFYPWPESLSHIFNMVRAYANQDPEVWLVKADAYHGFELALVEDGSKEDIVSLSASTIVAIDCNTARLQSCNVCRNQFLNTKRYKLL